MIPDLPPGDYRIQVWHSVDCGQCGRAVQFLSSQYVNRCGWCQTVVVRGVE